MEAVQIAAALAPADFEGFYRMRHDQVVRALTLTLRDRDLAIEAADEAMARAYQHWRSVQNYANPTGWTYRVGLNWAISRLRRARREVRGFRLEERGVEDRVAGDPVIDRALAGLPVGQRSAVVLRYYLDWSIDEIATALGIPTGTVKSRLHRGLEHLAGELEVPE